MSIPRARPSKIRAAIHDGLIFDLGLAIVTASVAARSIWRDWANGDKPFDYVGFGAILAVLVLALAKHGTRWWRTLTNESTHELEGCLRTLHAILDASDAGQGADPDLRLTIYVPINGGRELEQVCDYVGKTPTRTKKKKGRTLPIHCGIVGEAARRCRMAIASRETDDVETYITALVTQYGFTEAQARALDTRVMSLMAVPVGTSRTDVAGVVYIDSVRKDFFNANRQALVVAACAGMALFIGERYGS